MTLIYFLLILGVTVLVHELGHFIFAKRAGIYVYEFAIGMGPKLYSFNRKNDETYYSIRAIPLGGFVQMAGEEIEADENIPEDQRLQSKTWGQRFLTIVAGAMFNFIFAIFLLFLMSVIAGAPETRPILGELDENFPAYQMGMAEGDLITTVNHVRVGTWDEVLLQLEIAPDGEPITFVVLGTEGQERSMTVTPVL